MKARIILCRDQVAEEEAEALEEVLEEADSAVDHAEALEEVLTVDLAVLTDRADLVDIITDRIFITIIIADRFSDGSVDRSSDTAMEEAVLEV